jgi:regulatory helix-turn-helix LysR family protein
VLDDLHALVEFAQAGSIAGAADRLFRTPSAITRQLQRLEAALGAELLDRSTKPPRLNSLGSRVLERCAPARTTLQYEWNRKPHGTPRKHPETPLEVAPHCESNSLRQKQGCSGSQTTLRRHEGRSCDGRRLRWQLGIPKGLQRQGSS